MRVLTSCRCSHCTEGFTCDYLSCRLAVLLAVVGVSDGHAQQRRKSSEKQSEQSSGVGYQKCEGSLFFIEDGQFGPRCRRSDGKVCQVRGGTSGQAFLTDCK